MGFDIQKLEINGMPYEWVKHNQPIQFKNFNKESLPENLLQWQNSDKRWRKCGFLLSLLQQVRQNKEFLGKNYHVLAWGLPFCFAEDTSENVQKQWDLLGQTSKVHDFFNAFQVYVQQCGHIITRSESSNTELLRFITDNEDMIVDKIQEIVNGAGEDFWKQYLKSEEQTVQSGEKRKEKFPCIPAAVARVVCNDSLLYPILPGIYALYIMRKMGHTEKVGKQVLLQINGQIADQNSWFSMPTELIRQADWMTGYIAYRLNDLLRDYICCVYPKATTKKQRTFFPEMFFGKYLLDMEEDEDCNKENTKKGTHFYVSCKFLLPVCRTRKIALRLGEQYGLSSEEIRELHQKLPGFLYSRQNGVYQPKLSEKNGETVKTVLNRLRKISNPGYYCLRDKTEMEGRQKNLIGEIEKISIEKCENKEEKCGLFVKKYMKFWDPLDTVLFCCGGLPMELSGVEDICLFGEEIRMELKDSIDRELQHVIKDCGFETSTVCSPYTKPLYNELKKKMSLDMAMKILEEFFQTAAGLETNASAHKYAEKQLKKYVREKKGEEERMETWWSACQKNPSDVDWIYTRLVKMASKLVYRAAVGIFYRAVILDTKQPVES